MLIKLTVIIVSITLIIQSCIYEFTPKSCELENLLVIYGMVTNENGPHEITILKTKKLILKLMNLSEALRFLYLMIKVIQCL